MSKNIWLIHLNDFNRVKSLRCWVPIFCLSYFKISSCLVVILELILCDNSFYIYSFFLFSSIDLLHLISENLFSFLLCEIMQNFPFLQYINFKAAISSKRYGSGRSGNNIHIGSGVLMVKLKLYCQGDKVTCMHVLRNIWT